MPISIESINGFINNNLMISSILSKKDSLDLENDKQDQTLWGSVLDLVVLSTVFLESLG